MNRLLEKPVTDSGEKGELSTCGFFPLQPPSDTTTSCRLISGRESLIFYVHIASYGLNNLFIELITQETRDPLKKYRN